MNGNGGSGYSATPPLRETIYDLLYERDEHGLDGVQPTLQAFATCLGIQWMHVTPLSDLAKRILDTKTGHTHYLLSTATPVYAEQIRILVKECSRILNQGHAVNLGTCPNTDCNTPLTADETATTVKCRGCKNTWNINYLRSIMNQKILESDYTGTNAPDHQPTRTIHRTDRQHEHVQKLGAPQPTKNQRVESTATPHTASRTYIGS